MITASLVLYKTKVDDLRVILKCVEDSCISTVYCIDNSPTDTLKPLVDSLSTKVEYTQGQGNIGYGKAHNIGIKKAFCCDADYHIVLNPDISFTPDVIDELKLYFDNHSEVGLALPRVIYPDGRLQYLCKLLPTPVDIFGRRLLPDRLIEKRNSKFEMHEMGYDKVWNCPILSGCFMFMRVSALNNVGCFDDRFFMYFEDFDLMRRLHQVSKTVFYPKVTIVHNHAAEHHTNKALLKASIKSAILYFNKWGWLFDSERRKVNKMAFDGVNHLID